MIPAGLIALAVMIGIIAGDEAKAQTPAAVITVDQPFAIEPASAGADATPGTFTMRFINLTSDQRDTATNRVFIFRAEAEDFDHTEDEFVVSGYDPLPEGISAADWSNDLTLEYLPPDGSSPTAFSLFVGGDLTYRRRVAKIPSETYTFRVTPSHDDLPEGVEHVVFGFRIFFTSPSLGNSGQIRGVVNTEDMSVSIADAAPTPTPDATLTRDDSSIQEGGGSNSTFTLTLSNVPDGTATVTYTLAVSGDNVDPDDISAEFGGDAVGSPDTSGDSNTFTITATGGNASATLTITPRDDDDDATDEVVTLTIISIEFAGSSIGPDDIQGADVNNGALAITISDDDPAAIYTLRDSTASEPTSSTATDAATATFTITLSRLNTTQTNSPNRRFFFRVDQNSIGSGDSMTPGYGSSLPMGIDSDSLASTTDFNLSLEYQLENGSSVVAFPPHNTGTAQGTFSSADVIPKAAGGTDEVYRFHIIPTYDGNDEGAERVLFGYRVHFSGQDSHQLTGVVDGRAAAPAATIRDDAALRLRVRTFLEGALQ